MPETDFWALIDLMEGRADDEAVERLTEALEAAGKRRARAFQERLALVLFDLDREVLAGQPVFFDDEEVEEGDEPIPLSDDSFLYLRAGIVTKGRDTVRAVLADPTLLAQGRWPECEALLYAAEGDECGDEIDTKVSYETGSNSAHWSARPDVEPNPDWRPPTVLVDGEDRDQPEPVVTYHEDGTEEESTAYFSPRYLRLDTFFDVGCELSDIVTEAGGLPESFEGRLLQCVVEFGTDPREPSITVARHELDGEEVQRSSVWVSHDAARAWPKPDRHANVKALAARAALNALPDDHAARAQLERLAGT